MTQHAQRCLSLGSFGMSLPFLRHLQLEHGKRKVGRKRGRDTGREQEALRVET